MKVIIAEDEPLAVEKLKKNLKLLLDEVEFLAVVDNTQDLKEAVLSNEDIDCLFLDIELSDGKSINMLDKVEIKCPVIFTTAYDQYALEAFKVLSLGYLLKPIQLEELKESLSKIERLKQNEDWSKQIEDLKSLIRQPQSSYKERLLIKLGSRLLYKSVNEASYFFAEGKNAYMVDGKDNRKYLIDQTLEQLDSSLDPQQFFRISRKYIVNISFVSEVRGLKSTQIETVLSSGTHHALTVSRDRVSDFKDWLNR